MSTTAPGSAADLAPLVARALDPAHTDADATDERILDAALDQVAAFGVRRTTMDDVARSAGVGRMTVFRRFGSKENLVQALFVRELRRFIAALDELDDPSLTLAERVEEDFVVCLRFIRDHPLLDRLARVEPEPLLAQLSAPDGPALAIAIGFVAERIRAEQRSGTVAAYDPERVAEALVRVTLSFALFPGGSVDLDDEAAVRRFAREACVPLVDRS